MTEKKQPPKQAPKKKKKKSEAKPLDSTVDLQDLMEVTDEDLELLEMTERTLVAQTPEDEETITLKTGKEDEEDETAPPAEEEPVPPVEEEPAPADAEPAPADIELEAEDIELELIEEEPAEAATAEEGDEDLFGGADPSAYVWEAPNPEAGEPEKSAKRPAPKEKSAKKAPQKTAKKKKAAKQAAAPKEAPPEKAAPPKEPAEPAAPEAGSKKPVTLMLVSLLVLLVLGIAGGAVYFFFLQPSATRMAQTTPGQADRPVTAPAPAPEPRPAAPAPTEPPETTQPVPPPSSPTVTEERTAAPAPPAPAVPEAAPPPEPDVYTLHGIDFQQAAGELRVTIRTDDATGEYSFFPLSDPPRLVIDLFGSWNEPPFQEKAVATGPIRRLRLGEHDDKLRIVADMRSDYDMTPEFTRVADGIVMTLSTR